MGIRMIAGGVPHWTAGCCPHHPGVPQTCAAIKSAVAMVIVALTLYRESMHFHAEGGYLVVAIWRCPPSPDCRSSS
jgi:hypothetical protein